MFTGVAICDTDAVKVGIVNGTVFTLVAKERVVGSNLESTCTTTDPLVLDIVGMELDGLAAFVNALCTQPLSLLVNQLEPTRAVLVGVTEVKVGHSHPTLGGTKDWSSHLLHLTVHLSRLSTGDGLRSLKPVPSRGTPRLSIVEFLAGMGWILLLLAKVDELLKVEANLKDRLYKELQVIL